MISDHIPQYQFHCYCEMLLAKGVQFVLSAPFLFLSVVLAGLVLFSLLLLFLLWSCGAVGSSVGFVPAGKCASPAADKYFFYLYSIQFHQRALRLFFGPSSGMILLLS